MPLHLHDKDRILEACLEVFARHGYESTSTAMLANAAGVSKALIFHHYKSKPELYLAVLDHCVALAREALDSKRLAGREEFFCAREQFSLMKYEFARRNPDVYRVLKEGYLSTPEELHEQVEARQNALVAERRQYWRRRFAKVPLRTGVARGRAFELIMLTIDYFENRYLAEMTEQTELDAQHVRSFLRERESFLAMIRYGVQSREET